MLTIINDILDFSKMEAGKMAIEPIRFDLGLAIEEVAELLAPRAAEKGIDFILGNGRAGRLLPSSGPPQCRVV